MTMMMIVRTYCVRCGAEGLERVKASENTVHPLPCRDVAEVTFDVRKSPCGSGRLNDRRGQAAGIAGRAKRWLAVTARLHCL